jgi:hypothetical protein
MSAAHFTHGGFNLDIRRYVPSASARLWFAQAPGRASGAAGPGVSGAGRTLP